MALSEDQRALLQLLIAGERYEQIAELLGTSPGEVRDRAHAAASALEADPAGDISPRARQGAPGRTGRAPWSQSLHRTPRPNPQTAAGGAGLGALGSARRRRGGRGDRGPRGGSAGGGGDNGSTTTTRGDQEDVVPIRLIPVGGSSASGMISVVRVADQPAVDLAIEGLTPSGPGQSYVLWFAGSGGRSLPVAFKAVGCRRQAHGQNADSDRGGGTAAQLHQRRAHTDPPARGGHRGAAGGAERDTSPGGRHAGDARRL